MGLIDFIITLNANAVPPVTPEDSWLLSSGVWDDGGLWEDDDFWQDEEALL